MKLEDSEVLNNQRWLRRYWSWMLAIALLIPMAARAQFHGAFAYVTLAGPDGTMRAHAGDMITATMGGINMDEFFDTINVTSIREVDLNESGAVVGLIGKNMLAKTIRLDSYLAFGGPFLTEVTNSFAVPEGELDFLTKYLEVDGTDNFDGPNGPNMAASFQWITGDAIRILRPALQLRMAAPESAGSGSVSNCGNTMLANVVVSNFVSGVSTFLLGPITLEAGEEMRFSRNEPVEAAAGASSTPHSVVAWGTDELGLTVSTSVSTPPLVLSLSRNGDRILLSWNAVPGTLYQVQYTTSLSEGIWKDLGVRITGTDSSASAVDTPGPEGQRFYRVSQISN